MFYGTFVLAKKGPLAKVWLAAHWDKKLTKANIFDTDVEKTVEDIISPKVKLALRTSGHLLLGVVRIYSRKQKYLFTDLGEACAKIRMAFRPGMVDLPPEEATARPEAITMPEVFHNFETAVAEIGGNVEERFTINPERAAEITMAEDLPTIRTNAEIFDNLDLGGDFELTNVNVKDISEAEVARANNSVMEAPNHTPIKPMPTSDDSILQEKELNPKLEARHQREAMGESRDFDEDANQMVGAMNIDNIDILHIGEGEAMDIDQNGPAASRGEGFVLEQVDEAVVKERGRAKRKRKLVVDQSLSLSSAQIRDQLQSCDDLLVPKCFPPPTKKALTWKEMAGCEQLFSKPTYPFITPELADLVSRNYTSGVFEHQQKHQEMVNLDDVPHDDQLGGDDQPGAHHVDHLVLDQSSGQHDAMDQLPGDDWIGEEAAGAPPSAEKGEGDHVAEARQEGEGSRALANEPQEADSDGNDATGDTEEKQTEEMEQKRWTKRTHQVLRMITRGLQDKDDIGFSYVTKNCNRKLAASRFYTCLLLAKEGTIKVQQSEAFADIHIQRGPSFTEAY